MNLLFRVLHAAHAPSTHHKLALDALRYMRGPNAKGWQDFLLGYYAEYLIGSKDPDVAFKDFTNHVVHIDQHNWGGAPKAARRACTRMIDALRASDWPEAAYRAGVMSHYYTDPLMPFHTGQSQAETNIHRAAEWSITQSYDSLAAMRDKEAASVEIKTPRGEDWLEQMVLDGAELSHPFYEPLIEHYDFEKGVKNPPAGLDDFCREAVAALLAYAAVGFGRVLDRAFEEADIDPPPESLGMETLLATIKVPICWVTNKLADAQERKLVEAMYHEFKETGKLDKTLSEESRVVREGVKRAKERRANPQPQPTADSDSRSKWSQAMSGPSKSASGSPTSSKYDSDKPATSGSSSSLNWRHDDKSSRSELSRSDYTKPDSKRDSKSESEYESKHESRPGAKRESFRESSRDSRDRYDSRETHDMRESRETRDSRESRSDREASRDTSKKVADGPKFYLDPADDVEAAPTIGPRMAGRLAAFSVRTVGDLLKADAASIARKLNSKSITGDTIREWQDQARLACSIPQIRGHDAQILVACGYSEPAAIARARPEVLLKQALAFVNSAEGAKIIRSGKVPDRKEIDDWIRWAAQARRMKAA